MKFNWKTTLGGLLSAVATALAVPGVLPPPFGWVAQLVAAVGLALLGLTAADASNLPPPPKH